VSTQPKRGGAHLQCVQNDCAKFQTCQVKDFRVSNYTTRCDRQTYQTLRHAFALSHTCNNTYFQYVSIIFLGFPSVLGRIDGTHIKIMAPRENEAEYVNRKGVHSLNVQVGVKITYVS